MTFIVIFLILHLSFPTLRKESFVVIRSHPESSGVIQIMFSVTNFERVNTISISKAFRVCFCDFTLALYIHFFSFLLFLENRIIMLYGVGLFNASVEINRLITLCFSAGAGIIIFILPLHGGSITLVLRIPQRSVGSIQQEFLFCTGHLLAWRDCIFCLALVSAALLRIGRQGGFSSLSFPAMTVMVSI